MSGSPSNCRDAPFDDELDHESSWSAPRKGKNCFRKPRALDRNLRRGIFDFASVAGREFDCGRAQILLQAIQLSSPRYRYDPWFLCQQPSERNLCWGGLLSLGDALQQIDQREIGGTRLRRKARRPIPKIGAVKFGSNINFPGQETGAERTERYKTDPKFLANSENAVLFRIPNTRFGRP
jgi:hypothetical protein